MENDDGIVEAEVVTEKADSLLRSTAMPMRRWAEEVGVQRGGKVGWTTIGEVKWWRAIGAL